MDSQIISEAQAGAIISLINCCRQNGWRHALIGATALMVQGIDIGRITRDIDFTVAISSAGDPETMLKAVRECGFRSTRLPHRFKFNKAIVDILPVCDGCSEVIYWRTGERMSAVGLFEAVKYSIPKPIRLRDSAFEIPVAPVPIIVFMKLVACGERMENGDIPHARKHIGDVIACLKQCEAETDRRFECIDAVRGARDEFECAGAYLLGADMMEMLSSSGHSAETLMNLIDLCFKVVKEKDREKFREKFECLKAGIRRENYNR